jgi:hypothetical protein
MSEVSAEVSAIDQQKVQNALAFIKRIIKTAHFVAEWTPTKTDDTVVEWAEKFELAAEKLAASGDLIEVINMVLDMLNKKGGAELKVALAAL